MWGVWGEGAGAGSVGVCAVVGAVLMGAAIDTTSDVEILESLEFDPEHPCQWIYPAGDQRCETPAEWLLILDCCAKGVYAVCPEHRIAQEKQMRAGVDFHLPCGRVVTSWEWLPLKGGL